MNIMTMMRGTAEGLDLRGIEGILPRGVSDERNEEIRMTKHE